MCMCMIGIAPIVTSAMLFHMLTSAKLVTVNHTVRDERALLQGAQMLTSIGLSFLMTVLYVCSGMYAGDVVSGASMLLVILQLFGASLLMILWDQLLQKGYGIGSGVSLFSCCNVATDMIWQVIGFVKIPTSSGEQYPGLIPAIPHLLVSRGNKLGAIWDVFFRSEGGLSGFVALVLTFIVAGTVVYLQSFRVEVLVKHQRYRAQGSGGKYPIKLLYTGNIPLVSLGVVLTNVYFFSQVCMCILEYVFIVFNI